MNDNHYKPECNLEKQEQTSDPVNHPKHYKSHPSGIECIQITEHYNFNIGNVIKYIWRSGLKDGNSDIQDLKKAAWYLNREIQRIEKSESTTITKDIRDQC